MLVDSLKVHVPDFDPVTGDRILVFSKESLPVLAKPLLSNTYREANAPYWWPEGSECAGVAWVAPNASVRTLIVYRVVDDETLENTIRLGEPTPSGVLRPVFKKLGIQRIQATILTSNKALLAHLVAREVDLGGKVTVDEANPRTTKITIHFEK